MADGDPIDAEGVLVVTDVEGGQVIEIQARDDAGEQVVADGMLVTLLGLHAAMPELRDEMRVAFTGEGMQAFLDVTMGEGAAAKVLEFLAQVEAEGDDTGYVVVPRAAHFSNISVAGRILTWKERARELQQLLDRDRRLADILGDLDRCEHGRHEGDPCDGCAGPSLGNPAAFGPVVAKASGHPERTIGFTGDGLPIVVPTDPRRRRDPDAWLYDRTLCEGDAADGS